MSGQGLRPDRLCTVSNDLNRAKFVEPELDFEQFSVQYFLQANVIIAHEMVNCQGSYLRAGLSLPVVKYLKSNS